MRFLLFPILAVLALLDILLLPLWIFLMSDFWYPFTEPEPGAHQEPRHLAPGPQE